MKLQNALKGIISVILVLFLCFLLGCSNSQDIPQNSTTPTAESTFEKPDKPENISNLSVQNKFSPEGDGISLELPSGWNVENSGDGFAMFQNKEIPQIICLYYGMNNKNENHEQFLKRIN